MKLQTNGRYCSATLYYEFLIHKDILQFSNYNINKNEVIYCRFLSDNTGLSKIERVVSYWDFSRRDLS